MADVDRQVVSRNGSETEGVKVNQTLREAAPSEPHHHPVRAQPPLGAGPGLTSPIWAVASSFEIVTGTFNSSGNASHGESPGTIADSPAVNVHTFPSPVPA